jgi:predicted MPP superfamily phosphohydrolase
VVPARRWLAGLALAILMTGLFVSPGIGTSIIPVRFRVPPEISLITVGR